MRARVIFIFLSRRAVHDLTILLLERAVCQRYKGRVGARVYTQSLEDYTLYVRAKFVAVCVRTYTYIVCIYIGVYVCI